MELSQLPVRSRKDGARANQNLPGAKEITRVNVKGGPNITSDVSVQETADAVSIFKLSKHC